MRKFKKAKYLRICENVNYSANVVSKKFENFLARSSEVESPERRNLFLGKNASIFIGEKSKISPLSEVELDKGGRNSNLRTQILQERRR